MVRKAILISVLTAMSLLISAEVSADVNGSVLDNEWLRKVPTDGLNNAKAGGAGDAPSSASNDLVSSTKRIQRNQTLYFAVADEGGLADYVIDNDGMKNACTVANISDGCASAPLFVAATSLTICMDGDLEDATAGGGIVTMYICADSTCTRATSVAGSAVLGAPDECTEFGNGDSVEDAFNAGGSWVYVDVSTTPASGETLLVWVTAN